MLKTVKEFFTSSTGEGIALRIKSLLILAVPIVISKLCFFSIVCIAPKPVLDWVDSAFVVLFGIIHAYAWFRSLRTPKVQ